MTKAKLKTLFVELVDRDLVPIVERLALDEYTVSIASEQANLSPAELQTIINMGVGVQLKSMKFT